MPGAEAGLIIPANTGTFSTSYQRANGDDVVLPPVTQKRKYHEVESISNVWEPFRVRQPSPNPATNPSIFKPLLLLPRSCLPLAYLDTTAPNSFGQSARLFSARVAALESQPVDGTSYPPPQILIAEQHGCKLLYAIEQVRSGLFAQCRLGSWVTGSQLEDLRPTGDCLASATKRLCLSNTDNWWEGITAQGKRGEQLHVEQQTVGARRKDRLGLSKPGYLSTRLKLPGDGVPPAEVVRLVDAATTGFDGTVPLDPSQDLLHQDGQDPEDVLQSIRNHYMESLYRSKASLAYFAKGPLSRARAAFSGGNDLKANPHRLVEYLRTLILPLNLMDKKYRETVPTLVAELQCANISGGEPLDVTAKVHKDERRSKKEKVGKDGLYPQERVDISRWWLDRLVYCATYESIDLRAEAVKTTLLEQRSRETHLQMILILEILALESVLSVPSVEDVSAAGDESHPPKKGKAKKQQDLSMILDLFVDKLCIWQSMAVEEKERSREAGASQGGSLPLMKPESDQLRNLCIDVVLPFYAARLPGLSRSLCKKLGGPSPHSPTRPTLKRAPSSLKPPKPGAAVKRPQSRQARRTLERVLTDEKTCRRSTPALSRSATDSLLPNIKRETSDISLADVPLNRSHFHKTNRYSQREVDLTTVSQAAEVKARRKANVEEELRGAIAALKKPNPRMAVKELVEAAEQRAASVKSRKPKNPVRNPFAQGVQIMATPSANRHRDLSFGLGSQQLKSAAVQDDVGEIPPSSCAHAPASTVKHGADMVVESAVRDSRQRLRLNVEETPTRGPSKFSQLNVAAKSQATEESVQMTPSSGAKPKGSVSLQDSSQRPGYPWPSCTLDVQVTPSRKASTGFKGTLPGARFDCTSVKGLTDVSAKNIELSSAPNTAGVSVYKSLGWDDDGDEFM